MTVAEEYDKRSTDQHYMALKGDLDVFKVTVMGRIDAMSEKHIDLRGDVDALTKSVRSLSDTISSAVKLLLGGAAVISFLMSGYGVKLVSVLAGGQ